MKVWYLDHSAVAVKTEKHLLLFDLAGKALLGQPGEGLAEGCVSPDEIKDEDVLVFVSHEHKDHFDPAIFFAAGEAQQGPFCAARGAG